MVLEWNSGMGRDLGRLKMRLKKEGTEGGKEQELEHH
jgi:hypothetical protein